MTDPLEGPRLTAGRHGRRAKNLAILTVLVFLAMLLATCWYQLANPTPPAQGAAAAAPGSDGASAEPQGAR